MQTIHDHTDSECAPPEESTDDQLLRARIRAAVEILEEIGEDRSVLAHADPADQRRLTHAAGKVWAPDETRRRQLTRALAKRRKAEATRRREEALDQTWIRTLRRQPIFTTPNVYPPALPNEAEPVSNATAEEAETGPHDAPEGGGWRHCYGCKAPFTELHHFYDQMCPPCAELNYRKRGELADLRGRVALLTGGG